jgi:hypothetical protein
MSGLPIHGTIRHDIRVRSSPAIGAGSLKPNDRCAVVARDAREHPQGVGHLEHTVRCAAENLVQDTSADVGYAVQIVKPIIATAIHAEGR